MCWSNHSTARRRSRSRARCPYRPGGRMSTPMRSSVGIRLRRSLAGAARDEHGDCDDQCANHARDHAIGPWATTSDCSSLRACVTAPGMRASLALVLLAVGGCGTNDGTAWVANFIFCGLSSRVHAVRQSDDQGDRAGCGRRDPARGLQIRARPHATSWTWSARSRPPVITPCSTRRPTRASRSATRTSAPSRTCSTSRSSARSAARAPRHRRPSSPTVSTSAFPRARR